MSKKGKKDDKNSPDFEAFVFETRQAKTAILMLKSPEEDIQAKSAEAMFKFAMKSEENKRILHDLNSEEPLFSLLKEDNLLVRRNCITCLAIMSELVECRNNLRKLGAFHRTIIGLINAEEMPQTQEYALLCLLNMCKEYVSINNILKHNAFPQIVERLKSSDPDIVKNSIELIYELLLDFDAHSQLKQTNGMLSILDLLNSDYPVIQTIALKALQRMTKNSLIRTNLRELDALDRFVKIIEKPELNDLHLETLGVISNLLEDLECIQQMKSNGGLRTLLNIITDSTMFIEQNVDSATIKPGSAGKDRKSPGPAKKGSAKGKKKGLDDGQDTEKLPAFTLPEAKIFICQSLMKLCRLDDIRKVLHSAEVEKVMIILMSNDLESVRCAAANVLSVLAENPICQDSISRQGGIESLLRMTKSERKESKNSGINALASLTRANSTICRDIIGRAGVTEILLSCLTLSDIGVESISMNALTTILNLSEEPVARNKLVHGGIIRGLINQLKMNSTQVNSLACLVVAQLVCDEHSFTFFRQKDGVEHLVNLLKSPDAFVRRNASWAMSIVSADPKSADKMLSYGAIQSLKEARKLVGGTSPQFEICLKRLYDQNLMAKLCYTGYLDFNDVLPDIFYDVGALSQDSILETLEELSKAKVNQRRAVFIPTVEIDDDAKSAALTIEIKSKNIQLDNILRAEPSVKNRKGTLPNPDPIIKIGTSPIIFEESGKENVLPNLINNNDFQSAYDETLIRWVEQCQQMTESIHDTRNLAKQLALMGGPVLKNELMDFRYDLDHSDLKCKLQSNVIPIGLVRRGIHVHRAILYKFLADRIGLCVNFIRGDYNMSYNQIHLLEYDPATQRQSHFLYLIDLIHDPGQLYPIRSSQALHYIGL